MKTFFSITSVMMLILGIAWTLFPAEVLASWGIKTDDDLVYIARRQGGLFFGYCVIFWLARKAERSAARTAVLAGGLAFTLVEALLSVIGAVGVVGSALWLPTAIELVLAAIFAGFLFAPERPADPQAAGTT